MGRSDSDGGFTLVELMIVLAIIAIIAAIAIPNLLGARRSANEASAVESLRVAHSGQQLFHERDYDKNHRREYATSLNILASYDLIDDVIASGTKSGYYFTMYNRYNVVDILGENPYPWKWSWAVEAEPERVGGTGGYKYVVTDDGVVRKLRWDFEAEIYIFPWEPLE